MAASKYILAKDHLLRQIREHLPLSGRDQLKLVILLSVPSMLAQLSIIAMQYIDASMVGELGAAASASIGLVSTTIWLFSGVNHSLSTGYYVQVAHNIGAGNFSRARQIFRESLISCLGYSTLLALIGVAISWQLPLWLGGDASICPDATIYFLYFSLCLPFVQLNTLCGGMLRSAGNIHVPSLLNILMCVLDILFNYLLIFPSRTLYGITIPGAGLGVLGAVWGTALSYIICSFIMCYFACVRSKELNLFQDTGRYLPSRSTLWKSITLSTPIALERIVMNAAQIASTVIVAPLGTVAIAANSFGIIVESLCYMPGYGLADGATVLIGQSLGAGRKKLTRCFGRITLSMGIGIMSTLAVIMYFFSPDLMTLMSPDLEVQRLTVECLRIEAWAEPMYGASIVAYGIFVGAGDTLVPCLLNFFSIWAVRIPIALWLTQTMGLHGFWIAMAIELTFRGTIFLLRFRGNAWMKRVCVEGKTKTPSSNN